MEILPAQPFFPGQFVAGRHGKDLSRFTHKFVIQLRETDRRAQETGIEFLSPEATQLLGGGDAKKGAVELAEKLRSEARVI